MLDRKEAVSAREENRPVRNLFESDYLLGVFDASRMGALRYKLEPDGDFLDNDPAFMRTDRKAQVIWILLNGLRAIA